MEWMSPIDSSFLHVENDITPMHIGGVEHLRGSAAAVRGPAGDGGRQARPGAAIPPEGPLRAARRRLAGVDRRPPLQPRLPPAPHRDPGSGHARRSCDSMAGRVFSQHLDRNKPLWELWAVEGLKEGRWALLSKVHHCMVDGVAATDLMSVMFSDSTEPARGRAVVARARAVVARGADPHADATCHSVRPAGRAPARAAHAPGNAALARRDRAGERRGRAHAAPGGGLVADRPDRPAPALELGAGAPDRRQGGARGSLGGTVNDVVLTIITNGFRELLESRGEEISEGSRDPHDGPGVGAPAGGAGRLQQPCLGGVRGPAGRAARIRSSASRRYARRWTESSSPSRPSPEMC